MNIFRKIYLTLIIALVVLCYGYPMFVLPFGSYTYKEKTGDAVVEYSIKFQFDGSYSIKMGGLENTGYYKVKNGKIYFDTDKEVDTSSDSGAMSLTNMYTITSGSIKIVNNIGQYTMLGLGVLSLLLVVSIPSSRRRD